jgi:hypothetical protein
MNDIDHYQALEALCVKLKNSGAYFETSNTIARWWRVHESLSRGLSVSSALIEKYHPVILTVDKNGVLTRSEYREN